jgi:putative endonuclease
MSTDLPKSLGRLGEQLAADHFERLGWRIVARNHQTRFGELDVVAADGDVLIFCEVKTRRASAVTAWENLHGPKRAQVRRMAQAWLHDVTDRPRFAEVRFDAVGVLVDGSGRLVRLDHLEGAF